MGAISKRPEEVSISSSTALSRARRRRSASLGAVPDVLIISKPKKATLSFSCAAASGAASIRASARSLFIVIASRTLSPG